MKKDQETSMRIAKMFGIAIVSGVYFLSSPAPVSANWLEDAVKAAKKDVTKSLENALPGTGSGAVSKLLPGLVSGSFAKLLSGGDIKAHEAAVLGALATGAIQSWKNPETGSSGKVKVLNEKTSTKDAEIEVLKDRVEQVPPIELLGTNFTSTGAANVRGGPGTDYKPVGRLAPGTVVTVVGKVKGKNWYMISQGGIGTGFVSAPLLKETPAVAATTEQKPEGTRGSFVTTADQTCKTVEQSVTQSDGTTKTQVVTACRGANGWEIKEA